MGTISPMPELPEVETIIRGLRESQDNYETSIIGCHIEKVQIFWPRSIANMNPQEFTRELSGQTIQSLVRRGKFLVFILSECTLLIHLRMSGDLRLESVAAPAEKHDRLLLIFQNGTRLAFNDTRKFGRVWLTKQPEEVLGNLGPEPLSADFTATHFYQMLQGHSRQLKPLLMDQRFLAGLGNIYTDEALHAATIHPLARSNQLTRVESDRLYRAIRSVLREGIRRNGASIDWAYRGGEFQNHFRVYGRAGEPCPVCGTKIQRILVGQRSTHLCPSCQAPLG